MATTGEQVAATLTGAGEGIYALLDGDLRVRYVSEATRVLLGIVDDGVLGAVAFETVHPADLDAASRVVFDALAQPGVVQRARVRARPLQGPWRELEVEVTDRRDDPDVAAVVITGSDVTAERRAAIAGCLETRLLDSLPTALMVTDDAGVIVLWNRRATELYGYEAHEALGHDISELAIAAPPDVHEAILAGVAASGRWSGEFVTSRRDGTAVPVLVTVEQLDAPEIGFRGLVGAGVDISERRALEVTLAHRALHDPLTGLPNRALFVDRLDLALARLRRQPGMLAVLFIDLDRFKLVNDTCGHQAGDEVLRAVAALFEGVVRPMDTVARLGGDEFAVCCEHLRDPSEALALAERLTAALVQPFVVEEREFYVTPSIGLVLGSGAAGESATTLLRDADAAMYHAKDRGRGRVEVFDKALRLDVLRRAEVASDLRHALEREELVLHYQPVVRLADGELAGFEALLRWNHPERGVLQPGEFMDIAEDTNLIVPVGAWVLDGAARQLASWRDELPDHPITVSVNMSARQIADFDLVPTVRDVLERYRLDPSRLSLEITESTLMDDAEASVATLRELKALGVQLAIDDFGTGYSSLAYLKRFPVDFLKIDRSFVSGLDHGTEDAVIVRAVVELGRALGLGVVAEGVETDVQLALLERMGCELGQGYRWSKPCPPEEAAALVAGWCPSVVATSVGPAPTLPLHTPLAAMRDQCERLAELAAEAPDAAGIVAAVALAAEQIEAIAALLVEPSPPDGS